MNVRDPLAWQDALAQVPGAAAAADLSVQPLSGGTSNATFRVRTREGVFVVRLHAPHALDLGVDRAREVALHEAAAGAGLASRILAADPGGRFLVTEFLEGAPWQARDLEDDTRLGALAQTLCELHALAAPVVPALDLPRLLEGHVAHLAARDAALGQGLRLKLARAQDILSRQADAGRRTCIVHGDLSHGNMIGTGAPRLIDWEYAAVGDPLTDLACLAAYYPRVLAHGAALLELSGVSPAASVSDLAQLAWVYRWLSDLWSQRLALARCHPSPAH
ncbi:MAG TPA: choline/ethanolamine kinase family protein [Steroidobacteraceae bacterium]|nr:choline/ethanolamine kinase family protein [Steroidobacteraceae bacterium]